jgi:hypothetical protein
MRSIYHGGFEGVVNNFYQERSSLQFQMDYPELLEDGDEGDLLDTSVFFSTNYAFRKTIDGWDDWDGGFNRANQMVLSDVNQNIIYIGGTFTQLGSVPVLTNRFGYYDIATQSYGTLFAGAGANNTVNDVVVRSNGDVWICGSFTSIDGVASTYIAVYVESTGTWTPAPFVLPGTAYGMAIDHENNFLYVVGTDGGGGYVYQVYLPTLATTDFTSVARAVGSTAQCYDVVVNKDGSITVGGSFTSINGVSANSIASHTNGVGNWVSLGDGLTLASGNPFCSSMLYGDDGILYVLGYFDTADNISAENIASYNGTAFGAMGGGVDNNTAKLNALTWHDGWIYALYAGSGCSCANDITTAINIGKWNGTNWMHIDTTPTNMYKMIFDNLGNQYFSTATGNDHYSSGIATVTNSGTANAYPVIEIKGELVTPGAHDWSDRLLWIKNESTGKTMYFDLPFYEDEIITIDLRRGRYKIISNTRGNITGNLLPSSELVDFYIAPGDNSISCLVSNDGTPSPLISRIYWQIPHEYIEGAVF